MRPKSEKTSSMEIDDWKIGSARVRIPAGESALLPPGASSMGKRRVPRGYYSCNSLLRKDSMLRLAK